MVTRIIPRFVPYVVAGALALGVGLGCKKESDVKTVSREKTIEFALEQIVQSGETDNSGLIHFTEKSGEVVNVTIKDEFDNPVPSSSVTFFDGDGFKTYTVKHPKFTPYLHIFAHNSDKELRLTASPLQVHNYNGSTNENSAEAAQRFVDTLRLTKRHYLECITAEEAKFRAEEERNVLDFMRKLPGVGQVVTLTLNKVQSYYKVMDKLIELRILQGGECAAFQKWYIVPPTEKGGNLHAALWFWECLPSIPAEVCGDGIDNDCDGKVDTDDSNCRPITTSKKESHLTIEETIKRIFSCEPENFDFAIRHIYFPRFHERYSGDELEKIQAEFVKDYTGLSHRITPGGILLDTTELKKKWHDSFVGYELNILEAITRDDCYFKMVVESQRKVEITPVIVGNPTIPNEALDQFKPHFSTRKGSHLQEIPGLQFVPSTRSVTEALVSSEIHNGRVTENYKYFLLFVDFSNGQYLFLGGLQIDYDRTVK